MNQYGTPVVPLIPVRSEPSETAEMVTQVLFGETFSIIETRKKWIFIKLDFDGYEGWIDAKTYGLIMGDICSHRTIIKEKITWKQTTIGKFPILMGSEITAHKQNTTPYEIEVTEAIPTATHSGTIIDLATQFLHTPYLWGGRSALGIDCSGFTQIVFKAMGMKLPRDASQQALTGTTVEFVKDIKPGDLAFFDNPEGNITHVGILLNKHEIIHASGMVQINKFDHQGIFHPLTEQYTHNLRIIKRISKDLENKQK